MSLQTDRKIREDQDREYEDALQTSLKKYKRSFTNEDDDDVNYQKAIEASLVLSKAERVKSAKLPNANVQLKFRLLNGKLSQTYFYNENESVDTIALEISIDYQLPNISLQFQSTKLCGTLKESNVHNKSIVIVVEQN